MATVLSRLTLKEGLLFSHDSKRELIDLGDLNEGELFIKLGMGGKYFLRH